MQRCNPRVPLGLPAVLFSAALAAQDTAPVPDHQLAARPASTAPATTLPGYRPFDPEEPLLDWRAVNDEAGRLGGHGGQLAPAPQSQPHGEHR